MLWLHCNVQNACPEWLKSARGTFPVLQSIQTFIPYPRLQLNYERMMGPLHSRENIRGPPSIGANFLFVWWVSKFSKFSMGSTISNGEPWNGSFEKDEIRKITIINMPKKSLDTYTFHIVRFRQMMTKCNWSGCSRTWQMPLPHSTTYLLSYVSVICGAARLCQRLLRKC